MESTESATFSVLICWPLSLFTPVCLLGEVELCFGAGDFFGDSVASTVYDIEYKTFLKKTCK